MYAEQGVKIAVLPFDNMSGEFCPLEDIMGMFYQNLKQVVDFSQQQDVDSIIIERGLRNTGFLKSDDSIEICKNLDVTGILTGIIALYNRGKNDNDPRIGIILKLINVQNEAKLVWMDSRLATGSITETWFGLNRINDSDRLINNLFNELVREIPFGLLKENNEL